MKPSERIHRTALDTNPKDFIALNSRETHELADEVAQLEVKLEAYKNRENGMEKCERCSEWYEIERMNLTDDGVWLCPRDWDVLLEESD